ncbi:glycosyltransferase [Candidatus Marinimicrobia bacterium MT.SAG.3]|nr:glycosyltransferase [Candidatus Marinimicrobia bacterium MT.SAG.3]
MTESSKINIAVIAYTQYSRDPRVRRASDALVSSAFEVDCFVLAEEGKSNFEVKHGVNLIRLPHSQYRGSSSIKYLFSYLKFFLLMFVKLSSREYRRKYRLIHFNNMPDFIIFAGLFPKIFGTKLILDIHDPMPEVFKTKFPDYLSTVGHWLMVIEEKISAAFSDFVITVHDPIMSVLTHNNRINKNKITVIANFADESLFDKTKYSRTNESDDFKMIYHGTIATRFGLDIIIEGLEMVLKNHKAIKFNIYGKGDTIEELRKLITIKNMDSIVDIHGQIELDELPQKIVDSDLGIVSYRRSVATEYMLPLKLMEYMAMGVPVLSVQNKAISYYFNDGELLYYESDDADSFAEKLSYILNNREKIGEMKSNINKARKRMNWEIEKQKYIDLVRDLISES